MERHQAKIAVYLVLIRDGKLLLMRRQNTGWQDGNYSLPSGHVEKGETIAEALLREVKEETGLTLEEKDLEFIFTMHRVNKYIDLVFTSSYDKAEPENTEPEKCDDMSWFDLDNLPENMIPSVRFAIEKYRQGEKFGEFVGEG